MKDEIKTTILLESYLQNVGIGGKHLKVDFPKQLRSSSDFVHAAEELIESGLIKRTDINIPQLEPEGFCPAWEITSKGEDLLRDLDKDPSAVKELGIFDGFKIIIATGGSHVSVHDEKHHTETHVNISNIQDSIVKEIERSKADDHEKQEAKSRLTRFFEHPLLKTALEAVVGAALKAAS